jgi:hypothetical protein
MNRESADMSSNLPEFRFTPLKGYQWLIERGLVGFTASSQLQPWYFLAQDKVFSVTRNWPDGPWQDGELEAFARRQDNDDIACFHVVDGVTSGVVMVHGWTGAGYEVIGSFASFWEWVKVVIDDIAEWVGEKDAE